MNEEIGMGLAQGVFDAAVVWEESDVLAFHRRLAAELKSGLGVYCVQPAIEGVPFEAVYHDGVLTEASALSSHVDRRNVLGSLKTILTVPLKVERESLYGKAPKKMVVGGVVYLERKALKVLNADRERQGDPLYPDAGSAGADLFLAGEARHSARVPFNVFFSLIRVPDDGASLPSSLYDRLLQLQGWGFRVNRPCMRLCRSIEEVLGACAEIREKRSELPYVVTGVLIQPDLVVADGWKEEGSGDAGRVLIYALGPEPGNARPG